MKLIFGLIACFWLIGCKSELKETRTTSVHGSSPIKSTASPATKPIASTSIDHFWFETDQDNPPGRREWVKNADRWEERYEDGYVTKFKIVKMVPDGQYERPQLVRMADDKFDDQLEVLLPPPVEGAWFEFRQPGETEWHQYKQIHLFPATTRPSTAR